MEPTPRQRATQRKGWGFVAVQALLLAALIMLPTRDDWPTPRWVEATGAGLVVGGLLIVAGASLNLGRALTPTPVPNGQGPLRTDGLYRFVRHPIYSGVLAIVVGLTVASGSLLTLLVAIGTVAFFDRKAAWEEARLAERFPEPKARHADQAAPPRSYAAYAARTPRFVPRLRRRA